MENYLLAVTLFAFAVGILAAWSRKNRWWRWTLVIGAIVFVPLNIISALDHLSRPKEASWEKQVEEAIVLYQVAVRGEALYVLYLIEGKPRFYVYPWNDGTEKLGKKLSRAGRDVEETGQPIIVVKPFQGDSRGEREIKIEPLPQLPMKPAPTDGGVEWLAQ